MAGDSYSWIGGSEGTWNAASNWEDLNTGQVAAVAPGIADSATINGPDMILGTASVGTLTVTGDTFVLLAPGDGFWRETEILGDIILSALTAANMPICDAAWLSHRGLNGERMG
jgi:hypothetical protein